jgi:serine/threonine protein kinase/tetratricopeptide (TPR) repeat protein
MNDQDPTGLDRQARDVFLGAVEIHTAEGRAAYLQAACGQDAALRARVDALLQAHAGDSSLELTALRMAPLMAVAPVAHEAPGVILGRYQLLEKLGEGGFGAVWLAEQNEPVRRQVALKIIKLGMDTRQVVARFEAERQLLAMMDHPNIAKVFDAGATDYGRPYFVMELVRGIPITRFCDENRLSAKDRLDLFVKVCQAIQHAHQKGIIHRDLKPSNILVTRHDPDGSGVPKVIDFGIAKATQGELTDQTIYTQLQQFIGTPAYMSPEQAGISATASGDIDTRSDIYSLGVLLYELLTGTTPFDAKELLAAGLDEMRRIIREQEPVRPSTRLTQQSHLAVPSESKIQSPKSKIEADLDWIVMKCLEKDRARRYEAANGLARDVERHLNNEPVIARPPSRLYSFQKAVRRNKTIFAASAIIVLVLILGVCASVWQAVRATQAKKQALAEEHRADEEAAKQQAINGFLNDMLASASPYARRDPNQARGGNIRMQEILDAAARQVKAGSLKERPAIEAAICQTLGRTYLGLHQAEAAEPLVHRALELNRQIYGEQSDPVTESLSDVAAVYREKGRGDEEEKLLREVVARERKRHGKDRASVTGLLLRRGDMLNWLGDILQRQDKLTEAESAYREVLDIRRRILPGSADVAWSAKALALNLAAQERFAEAELLFREAVSIWESTPAGPAGMDFWDQLEDLSQTLKNQGKLDHLEALYRDVLARLRKAPGDPPAARPALLCRLADLLVSRQRSDAAVELYREAESLIPQLRSGENLHAAVAFVESLRARRRFAEAEKVCARLIETESQNTEETRVLLGHLLHLYGDLLDDQQKFEGAVEKYFKALSIRRLRTPDIDLQWTLRRLGSVLIKWGKAAEGEHYLLEALAYYRAQYQGEDLYGTAWTTMRLADALAQQRKLPEAEGAYRQAILCFRNCQSTDGEDYRANYRETIHSLVALLKSQGKVSEAQAVLDDVTAQPRRASSHQDRTAVP